MMKMIKKICLKKLQEMQLRQGAKVAAKRWIHRKSTSNVNTRFIPRRALMYVPGSDERKLSKIPQIQADCICLDIEDGVAYTAKEQARSNIRTLLSSKEKLKDFGLSECTVRVNSIQSNLCHLDLDNIFSQPDPDFSLPSAIHLPKVDTEETLDEFAYIFNSATSDYLRPGSKERVGLIMFIESAQSLINLKAICEKALALKQRSALVPEALVFGSDDFVADIGGQRTASSVELLYARQKIVAHAKACGFQCIDLVHIDFKNLEGLREQSLEGARMGFTGKQVIHPTQVPVVHEAFLPSSDRVEWATELIKGFREHEKSGKGAFTFRGSMIDMPLVKQAENILITHQKISEKS